MFGRKKKPTSNRPSYRGTIPPIDPQFRQHAIDNPKTTQGTASGVATTGAVAGKIAVPQRRPNPSGTDLAVANKRREFEIDFIPEGIIIKRTFERPVKPGHAPNRWRVNYWNRTPEYFGVTLDQALHEFFKNNDDLLQKYLINLKLARG